MRKVILILLITILLLSTFPLYSFASGSCTGSNPVSCTFADMFSFLDQAPLVILGIIVHLSDKFKFADGSPNVLLGLNPSGIFDRFQFIESIRVSFSQCPTCNPFVTTGQTNSIIALDTVTNTVTTGIILPIFYMIGVLFFAIRLNIKEFPILLALSVFTFLGLIYVGVFPSWSIVFPIIFGAVISSLIVSKWLGARGTSES